MSMIAQLKSEYGNAGVRGGLGPVQLIGTVIKDNGFAGTETKFSIIAQKSLSYQAPACIASPVVHLEAREEIALGTEGQGEALFPVRIYAPDQLVMKTNHLIIGEIQILVPPAELTITCERVTLLTTQVPCEAHLLIQNSIDRSQTTIETMSLVPSYSPANATYSLSIS